LSIARETRAHSAGIGQNTAGQWWQMLALLAVFVVLWTVYPVMTRLNLDPYGDMLENFAWGIGWQWGYFKHPPFFAWTTAAWFEVFPRADWAYYLLSAVNAALAVFLSWRIALRFLDPWRSLLAAALFFFLPPTTFLATKFNANSALLPLWPLIVLFYLRFLENRKLSDALILGVAAAIGMLTKYFTAVLLLPIVLHILFDREARSLLRTPTTWIAAAIFLVALVPHFGWLVEMDFLPITYAASQGDGHVLDGVTSGIRFLGALILYALPMVLILYIAFVRNRVGGKRFIERSGLQLFRDTVAGRALAWTTFGSIIVTLIIGIVLGTRLSSVWGLPMFFAVPIFLLAAIPGGALEARRDVIPVIVAIFCSALIAATPFVLYLGVSEEKHYSHVPVEAAADALEVAWSRHTNAPLMYVAGDKVLSSGASFYGKSKPYSFIDNSFAKTPWIKPEDIARHGMAIACLADQAVCEQSLESFPVEFSETETVSVLDATGKEWTVKLHFALPENG